MIVRYPLRLFFDCSTAHLSPAARDYLEQHAAARDEMIATTPYGWFVWCGEADDIDVPPELGLIQAHARSLDAEYILFDADAEMSEALPTFHWPP